ncbi:MAG: serine/threonine protein phosphatase [Hyphomicrobiales bacterium]|nr:MAG: serine/threonine protein phosphatase [Hyphomicrobiales bacterium]
MSLLDRLFRRTPAAVQEARQRLTLGSEHQLIYAIGDIHGHLDLLLELEALIETDRLALGMERTILLLGDLVDRGPRSAQVLDHVLMRQRSDPRYFCLAGNHEEAMLDFFTSGGSRAQWLRHGGIETLMSYGMPEEKLGGGTATARAAAAYVPDEHIAMLQSLPVAIDTEHYFFAHAGARPGVELDAQTDHDLLWFKDGMASQYDEFSKTIVHGHDALTESAIGHRRINVDTGAFVTGRLSSVRLLRGYRPAIIAVEQPRTGQTKSPIQL